MKRFHMVTYSIFAKADVHKPWVYSVFVFKLWCATVLSDWIVVWPWRGLHFSEMVNYCNSYSSEHNVFDLTRASSTLQQTRAEGKIQLCSSEPRCPKINSEQALSFNIYIFKFSIKLIECKYIHRKATF